MAHYEATVMVDTDRLRGMQDLADVIADALERRGVTVDEYDVTVTGPPELRIGLVSR